MITLCVYDGGCWARLSRTGPGISIVDRGLRQPPFSVRHGYARERRIGPFGIQLLAPIKGRRVI